MKLIVGLGNPGEKYERTRHNLGFVVLDGLLQELEPVEKTNWKKDKKFNSQLAMVNLPAGKAGSQLLLTKPQTMMNGSGQAVQKIARFYRIKPEDIWIVHDDVDILLGRIKIRQGGAAAGHHGVESVIEHLGTDDFVRFRLGIGKAGRGAEGNVEAYVLREFDINEVGEVKLTIKKAVEAIQTALEKGLEKAMNRFNQ
jgi:PTH1 family peptidyl-tRNA hydrolase